jgi:hypothetical protein
LYFFYGNIKPDIKAPIADKIPEIKKTVKTIPEKTIIKSINIPISDAQSRITKKFF